MLNDNMAVSSQHLSTVEHPRFCPARQYNYPDHIIAFYVTSLRSLRLALTNGKLLIDVARTI